ncbi:MAG: hypothetical protein FJ253_00760, partial [Phycisphaerae bacterium]|nr:hypothetical protein [Phycisphaerae bacterium]
ARVTAKVGSATYMRYLDGGHGYGSSSEPMIHFGLGNATLIDELTIEFPPGYEMTLTNVAVNQRLLIQVPKPADLDCDGAVNGSDLGRLLGAWGQVGGADGRVADLNGDLTVNGNDLAILLEGWEP